MKKQYGMKHLSIAFLCGSVFFSGIALAGAAEKLEVSASVLKLYFNGEDKTAADGMYDNQGSKVPASLVYGGTTYVPLRMVGEAVGSPVYWEAAEKAVSIGQPYIRLTDGKGKTIGSVILSEANEGVELHIQASGLTPGKHGFHIHQNSIENFDFKTAGGHFNPEGKQHGHDNPEGHHLGDMPNLEVAADGTVEAVVAVPGVTLEPGKENSILGKSFIIHAAEDDHKSDPAGNAGDRVAGGNIPQ